ncbi:sporulation integral membrane protein YlbJ [Alkaliphilus peptidifermentans]|uniref:Sporulation integral membrane protein YlbJ n=1 Tax=Alkaliphilus peptidifermentans DSM 18978 TaxID=1120976 RepID=A0A1G5JB13_9FIRM|nr:sporulation integral membrane protein YlbJ [Alkaliphilus peptidifermentans]SCY85111.1 sporulation integral membrane protein YlbJ [Alkaliphilus peptidifermentans DSM 18978]
MLSFFIVAFCLAICIILLCSEIFRQRLISFITNYLIVLIIFLLVIAIIIYPDESVNAAYIGLMTWFSIVLPALLPFFIGSELLIGLGVVKFIGILLEPIMRPLFNVPGEGSFAFAMSITSGYPVGAKIVTKLRSDNVLTPYEAQRLVSFCSTSGPLFIMGAVGVGMFQSSEIGIFLAICHYLGAITVGLLFSFYKKSKKARPKMGIQKNYLLSALRQLAKSRRESPSFGILLGRAVKESINTMLMVGGFIILFSVIINIFDVIGLIDFFTGVLLFILKPFNLNHSLIKGLITSIFEITIGCKMVAEASSSLLVSKIAVAAFAIAWSGFSIHAQAISIISTSDIRVGLYIFSKLLHGALSSMFVFVLYPIFSSLFQLSKPVFFNSVDYILHQRILDNLKLSVELFIGIVLFMLFISLFASFIQFIIGFFKRKGRRF